MKAAKCLLPLLCALMLAACAADENCPPDLSVTCGETTIQVGAWSAGWDGGPEGTNFIACGDVPTSIYARPDLIRFEGVAGEKLILTYGEPPDKLTVYFNPDKPGEREQVTLFEGIPEKEEIVFTLPEDCGGIYEAYANWDKGGKGEGYTSCGWLVTDPGREAAVLEQGPPDLTVAYWGDCEVTAWKGNYSWSMLDGDSGEAVIACGPHPLDVVDDLPVVEAREGDTLVLAFEAVPDKVEVEYFCREDSALDAQSTPYELAHGSMIHLQEGMEGTVWVVRGKWETSGTEGSVEYAFYVPS